MPEWTLENLYLSVKRLASQNSERLIKKWQETNEDEASTGDWFEESYVSSTL